MTGAGGAGVGGADLHLLAAIVEHSDDAILSTTLDGTILSWNDGAVKLYGYTAAEMVGRPTTAIVPPDRLRELLDLLNRVRRGEHFRHYETQQQRKDGTQVPVSLTISPLRDEHGAVIGVASIARDVSGRRLAQDALRRAEERMRFALEASQTGVWEANLKTGYTYWSDLCEAMHGLSPGTFRQTFDAFLERIHADDRDRVIEQLQRAVNEGADASLEYRTVWDDGSVHQISTIGRVVRGERGDPERIIGVAVDVTDRRSLEEQLRQSQKMEAIGQLAGGVAHDFNNLLTAIQGYAELLTDGLPDTDERRSEIEQITRACERASRLTRQLLAFSRKQLLSPTVLRVGDVVEQLSPMLRRLLGETIDLKTLTSDERSIKADAGQLEQILVNLAINARDAMLDGGRLTIETADLDVDEAYQRHHASVRVGPHVVLVVSDTGHGMDAATAKRIFEPFFTTKELGRGTGLGLSTVYGIVQQSGGDIWVESVPGRGTTFTVCLPALQRQVGQPGAALSTPPPMPRGTETVLVVEDETAVRELTCEVLRRQGYTVLEAADGREGLSIALPRLDMISLIISDVVMPGMSGPQFVQALTLKAPHVRVLFTSGYTDGAIVNNGHLKPGLRFLPKPFSTSELVRSVRQAIDEPLPRD